MDEKDRLRRFLADLGALAVKHGLVVSGCGCCGSPGLDPETPSEGSGYAIGMDRDVYWVPAGGVVSKETRYRFFSAATFVVGVIGFALLAAGMSSKLPIALGGLVTGMVSAKLWQEASR